MIRMKISFCVVLLVLLLNTSLPHAQPVGLPSIAHSEDLDKEILGFLGKELAAHVSEIKSYEPAPDKVFNAGTTGEYTWGTFMNAVGAYAALSKNRELAGRDLAHEVGQVGLLEARLGGTRFSQLYGVQALRHFGRDLNANPVWQELSEAQRAQWRKFLDVSAFYDPRTQQVINLPENYLGVAARIASISYQLGLLKDRALLDGVITRAARPFLDGGLYADDAPPTGRFDRYSNEYARFVWIAAEDAGRNDILDAVRPSLKAQMRLWWDLVLPDGYGYAWGRSMGVVSYEDTMEIVGFLARHPEFRPAPLDQLASAYYQSWRWLRRDYNDKSHVLSVFAFGRGNYSYITREREWQQTTAFIGKAAQAQLFLAEALEKEKVNTFPTSIPRQDVARFEFFRHGKRPAGVWIVRQGSLFFTLPITTGTRPGVSDYLPAPHGLNGFANPVEQNYPALVPFLQLADGRTLVAADGADEIEPGADGRSLRVVWRRWVALNGKAGELLDPKITSEVVWRIEGSALTRTETLRSEADIELKRWWVALPSILTRHETSFTGDQRLDVLKDEQTGLAVEVKTDWPASIAAWAPGDSALGRGARQPLALHLIYESPHLKLPARKDMHWRMTIKTFAVM
ncbi:MAG: hypothetical protein JWM21_3275 [Acidobacteria bacterium]|nr:hypothetical protein [Acidobacteriota bacterium]